MTEHREKINKVMVIFDRLNEETKLKLIFGFTLSFLRLLDKESYYLALDEIIGLYEDGNK